MRFSIILTLILLPFLSFAQRNDLLRATKQWSEAASNQDLRALSSMYAENLVAYGKTTTRRGILRAKLDFYLKNPDYSQAIVSAIEIDKENENQYRCAFTKQYWFAGKPMEVVTYLFLSNTSGTWKIVKETDEITEKRTVAKAAANKQVVQANTPLDAEKQRAVLEELLK
jgi:hypothetical protein